MHEQTASAQGSDTSEQKPATKARPDQRKPVQRKPVQKPKAPAADVPSLWMDPTDVSDHHAAEQAQRDLEADRPPHY